MSMIAQEIIDQIIDHVATTSTQPCLGENLLQCAAVSRSFRPRSQRYIFSSINIRGGSYESRLAKVQDLLDILHGHPELGRHVEELHMQCSDLTAPTRIFEDKLFIDVMKRITPLREFEIGIDQDNDDGFDVVLEDTESLLNNFILPFIAPSITSLFLNRLSNMPCQMVACCTNVTELSMYFVQFSNIGVPPSLNGPRPLTLQRLTHRRSQAALWSLLYSAELSLDISRLKTFTIHADDLMDLDFEQRIIDLSSDSLEHLQIRLNNDCAWVTPRYGSANLQKTICLRFLDLCITFPDVASVYETLSSVGAAILECLNITANVTIRDIFGPEAVSDTLWAELCSEILRVMAGTRDSALKIELVYFYNFLPKEEADEYWDTIHALNSEVMEDLCFGRLASLYSARFPFLWTHSRCNAF